MNMIATTPAIAVATAVTIVPALAGPAASDTMTESDAQIERLWIERTTLAAESRALWRAHQVAESQMPEWAAPGPMYLCSDGAFRGSEVGWPRLDPGRLPEGRAMINVRPSPHDIKRGFDTHMSVWGPCGAKAAQAAYDRRMADLNERQLRQRVEREKVGLPANEAQAEAVSERILDINEAIEHLAGNSPTYFAVMLMLGLTGENVRDALDCEGLGTVARCILPRLRPQLSGLIARHVDDLIEHPSKLNGEREFVSA